MEQQPNTTPERTFSQADVDRIVQNRLAEEKKKYSAEADSSFKEREKALNERESRLLAREKLMDAGLPADLIDTVNYSSPETLEKSIATLKGHISTKDSPKPMFTRSIPYNPKANDPVRDAFFKR